MHPLLTRWQDEQINPSCTAHTARQNAVTINRICAHRGLADPRDLRTEHVTAYLATGAWGRPLKPRSRNVYLSAVRKFAAWAEIPDPTAKIQRAKVRPNPKPIPEPTLEAILVDTLERDRVMYELTVLGAWAGLRAAEAGALRSENVLALPDGTGIITVADGKGSKTADVYVGREVIDAIGDRLGTDGPLYGLSGYDVTVGFIRAAKKAGQKATFHQTRARFITETYYASGCDPYVTRDQARHDTIETGEHYVKVREGKAKQSASRLPTVPGVRPGQDCGEVPQPHLNVGLVRATLAKRLDTDREAVITEAARAVVRVAELETQLAAVKQAIAA